jgi:hypothetical protein
MLSKPILNRARNLFWLSFSLPEPDSSILNAYRSEFAYALNPGWDGDAPPIAQSVVDLAERLLGRYATTTHLVEVSPGEDGSLSFVWNDEGGNYIYLDVGPGDTVHLYCDLANGSKWEGVSVASDARILDRLTQAFRNTGWPLHQLVIWPVSSAIPNAANVLVGTS